MTGLAADTSYRFEAKAVDGSGNFPVGPTLGFDTLAPPPDSTPPTVTIVSPSPGSVSGAVLLEAAASDNVGVTGVQFKLDGVNLGVADATAPYSISWNTIATLDGPHTITAESRDAANNVASASVEIYVSNSPVASTPFHVRLDGIDDYVQVADSDSLSFGNGRADTPFTIEAWIGPASMAGKQTLISKSLDGPNQEYKLYIASSTIRLDLRDSTTLATMSAYTVKQGALAGGWHHLAVTYDGRGGPTAAAGITIYVDGIVVPITRIDGASYVAMQN